MPKRRLEIEDFGLQITEWPNFLLLQSEIYNLKSKIKDPILRIGERGLLVNAMLLCSYVYYLYLSKTSAGLVVFPVALG